MGLAQILPFRLIFMEGPSPQSAIVKMWAANKSQDRWTSQPTPSWTPPARATQREKSEIKKYGL